MISQAIQTYPEEMSNIWSHKQVKNPTINEMDTITISNNKSNTCQDKANKLIKHEHLT